MIGAPKPSAGGFGITSMPRSTGTEGTRAPTTRGPETGKGAKQTEGGREAHNPLLQRLMEDGFEGQGAQGKGLALGHHKEKKAGKKGKGGGEAGEAPPAGQPAGKPQAGLEKLLADLTKLLGQFQGQYPQPQAPTAPTAPTTPPAPNGNTGIVPPGVVQGSEKLPLKLGGI